MFGEMVGRVCVMAGGRVREGVALSLSECLLRCVIEWNYGRRCHPDSQLT